VLQAAIAAVSRAAGLRFIDDGPTSEGPTADREAYQPARYGDQWAPVLIAWATPQEVPDFGIDVAGEAGPVAVGTPSPALAAGGPTSAAWSTSTAASSPRWASQRPVNSLPCTSSGTSSGLSMSRTRIRSCTPSVNVNLAGYAAGDLAGLAALGRGSRQPSI